MKRTTRATTIALVLASFLIVGSSSTILADDHRGCSTRGAAGNWSYRVSGSLLTDPSTDTYPTDVPVAGVGTFNLDRNGNVSGGGPFESGNGVEQITFSGTYSVDSSCTGSLAIDIVFSGQDLGVLNLEQVFGDNMNQVHWLVRNSGFVITFDGSRLFHD